MMISSPMITTRCSRSRTLWQLSRCGKLVLLEESVNRDPAYLPALGNLGNTLLAHAQLKLGLAAAVEATPGAGAQELQASVAELQKEAVDMLVMAGRHYRALLESDSGDGLAFTFWGRALALRGDIIALADGQL